MLSIEEKAQIGALRATLSEEDYPETYGILTDILEREHEPEFSMRDVLADLFNADAAKVMAPAVGEFMEINLKKAIQNGDMDSACDLGALYYTGRIGVRDFAKALKYYTLSANGGNLQAAENLGYCYYYGRATEKDYGKAFHWFARGAFLGRLTSLYKIGDMYRYGLYVPQDNGEAFSIYIRCLQTLTDEEVPLCGADIFIRIGDCLFEKIGVEQDLIEALHYYQLAERCFYERLVQGDFLIQKQYEKCIERGNKVRELLQKELPDYEWTKDEEDG